MAMVGCQNCCTEWQAWHCNTICPYFNQMAQKEDEKSIEIRNRAKEPNQKYAINSREVFSKSTLAKCKSNAQNILAKMAVFSLNKIVHYIMLVLIKRPLNMFPLNPKGQKMGHFWNSKEKRWAQCLCRKYSIASPLHYKPGSFWK